MKNRILIIEDSVHRIRSEICSTSSFAPLLEMSLADLEREYILETLNSCNGNKSKTAELLGLDRKTLYRKLDEYEKNP